MSDNDIEPSRARGLTEHEVAKLGGFGVVRESVKLFGGLHPSLVWIQFAFVLPFTVYQIVSQYAQQILIKSLNPDLPPPPAPPSLYIGSLAELKNSSPLIWLGILLLPIFTFCLSLVIPAAIFYAVGSICNGRNVTFSEVAKAVPRLWGRLFVTAVVYLLLMFSVSAVFAIFLVVFQLIFSSVNVFIFTFIFGVLFFIPIFILNLMYEVAVGVTCYEDYCGISAFKKAKHILHDKWISAVVLIILLSIPSVVISSVMYSLTGSPFKFPEEFQWKWLVLSIFYVILISYLTELVWIAWAVFYFSCTANYEQNVQIHHEDQLEGGYEPIAPALA